MSKKTSLSLLDWKQDFKLSYRELRDELLKKAFPRDYSSGILQVIFNKKNLAFQRNINISQPIFQNEEFDSCILNDIPVQPKTVSAANEWRKAILSKNIDRYFYDEAEFQKFEAEKRGNFHESKQPNLVTRKVLINHLKKETHNFYKLAKLETADLLTY